MPIQDAQKQQPARPGGANAVTAGNAENAFLSSPYGQYLGQQQSLAGQIAGDLYSQAEPGLAANQIQTDLLNQQMNTILPGEYSSQQNILGENYGYQQQQYGVQGQQLGLSQLENRQQQQQLGAEYGFQQQQNTLSGQNIQAAIGNIMKNYGIQSQQLGQSEQQAMGGLVGAGTYNSANRGFTEKQFGLERQSLQQNMQYAVFQQEQSRKSLGISEAEQKEQFGYSTEQLKNGYQQLNLELKGLGISQAQAHTQYQNALQQLGLSNYMNVNQLEQQLAAIKGGGYSPLLSIAGQLQQALPGIGLFQQVESDLSSMQKGK